MSDLIDAIAKTRETGAEILAKSLVNIDELSEIKIREKIISEIKNYKEIFTDGWYSPPPHGICVLLDQQPFKRLQFETLRKPSAWPTETSHFKKETVGIIYISPVDRKTGMFGDIGLTIYNGSDKKIQEHIRACYDATLAIAHKAEVGMKFSDLSNSAENIFKKNLKLIGWMTTINDPTLGANLGHTVPGSFGENMTLGGNFEEIKNTITKNRIYINAVENFEIPKTCAFTVEARLVDTQKELPNVFFHFIVCFDNGKKAILENFSRIFKVVGMDYMNVK